MASDSAGRAAFRQEHPTWAHFVDMDLAAVEQVMPSFEGMPQEHLLNFLLFGHSDPGERATLPHEPTMLGAAVRAHSINPIPLDLALRLMGLLVSGDRNMLLRAADGHGWTPLLDACAAATAARATGSWEDAAVVARLLDVGAGTTVNATDALGRSPLLVASRHGAAAAARCLVALGADIEVPRRGRTLELSPFVIALTSPLLDSRMDSSPTRTATRRCGTHVLVGTGPRPGCCSLPMQPSIAPRSPAARSRHLDTPR